MTLPRLSMYAFVIAVVFFIYRRRTYGEGRAEVFFYSVLVFGAALSAGSFFFFKSVFGYPQGMGLELFVYPAFIMIGSVVAALILSPLFMHFENRWINGSEPSHIPNLIEKDATVAKNGVGSDWREFARSLGPSDGKKD